MANSIPGVIVTYFPDAGFAARAAAIASQVAPLLIIDNTTDPTARARLAHIAATLGAEFLPQPCNSGIAGGLNAAFTNLHTRGFSDAVAFDQDSTPQPGCVSALATCASQDDQRAVVGSNWYDEVRPNHHARHLMPHRWMPILFRRVHATHADIPSVTFAITSGSWFSLSTWQALGGFDESLFLDLVDVDYSLRAQSHHSTVAVAASAHLAHNRGNKRPVRLLGHTWWPAFMPPKRLTGLSANRMRLILRHGWHRPYWAIYEVAHTCKIAGDIIALEDAKFSKLFAIAKGCLRGLLRRTPPQMKSTTTTAI